MPVVSLAQTTKTATTQKGLTFCGVPFGISVTDFSNKTKSMSDSLANLVGVKKCIIYSPNVNLPKKSNIACSVQVSFEDDYGTWVLTGFDMLRAILVAKYGNYTEYKDYNGRLVLTWKLSNGMISLERAKEYAVIDYYDFASMKKAYPNIFKNL